MEIRNLDELINQFVPKTKSQNKNPFAPVFPSRAMIIAPSGGGKTNIVMNLVLDYLQFDRLYLYVKDLEEDKYQFLLSYMQSVQKQYNEANDTEEQIFFFSDRAEDIINVNDLDKDKQNLIIIDDSVLDKEANEKVSELFIRGRKRNALVIYQTQSYFDVPKIMRLNSNYVILLNANNQRELIEIAKTYASDIDFQEFKNLYKQCTAEPFGFMVIDAVSPYKCMKYRCNFDGLYCEENNNN